MIKRSAVKRTAFLMAIGMMLAAVQSGCSSSANSSKSVPASEAIGENKEAKQEDDVSIKFQYWADNTDYSQLMQDIIAKFNAENDKGITVIGEEQPWDGGAYAENLFNAKMGGSDVDVSTWKLTSTPLFVNNDLLLDLSPYIDGMDVKGDIDENIYNVMKQAGGDASKIFVMPWNIQVLYVYYRPSIFEKAGIEKVPDTYEEFLDTVRKCTLDTDSDGKTDVYGFGMRGAKGGQEPWGSFIYAQGGDFNKLNSDNAIRGMQDFIELYTNGYVPPTATSDGFNEIIANFQSGLTAMTIHHTGSSAKMEELFGEDVSAFPFPAGKGQWTSMGDTETVIFSSCKHPEAAFEWVKYLATGEGQQIWCEGTGNVPVSKSVAQGEFFQGNRFMKASLDGESYAGILPILDTTTEWISSIWPNTVSRALIGEIDAEQAMNILHDGLWGAQ